jgi:hypothetical protein
VVAGAGVPPVAGTFIRGPPASGANTIRFDGVQTPPRAPGASAITSARPPAAAIVLSLVFVKYAMRVLSGDQNGSATPASPSRRRAVIVSSDRTQSSASERLTLPMTNATIVPSGEIATPVESG